MKEIEKLKVVYYSDSGPGNTVFSSQVMGMAKSWMKLTDTSLLFRARAQNTDVLLSRLNVGRSIRSFPNVARPFWLLELFINYQVYKELLDADIVHCRGPISTWQALIFLKYFKKSPIVIFDCRGAFVDELKYSKVNSNFFGRIITMLRRYEYRRIEEVATRDAQIVSCVTTELSNLLCRNYQRTADSIIPPLVDSRYFIFSETARSLRRKELCVKNEQHLFVFVGGADGWQRTDLLFKWWETILQHEARLLILTPDILLFKKTLKKNNINYDDRVLFRATTYELVGEYLSASDTALIFRDDTLTNRVAHPTKISEYLVSGLKIITNESHLKLIAKDNIFLTSEKIKPNGLTDDRENSIFIEKFSFDHAVQKLVLLAKK